MEIDSKIKQQKYIVSIIADWFSESDMLDKDETDLVDFLSVKLNSNEISSNYYIGYSDGSLISVKDKKILTEDKYLDTEWYETVKSARGETIITSPYVDRSTNRVIFTIAKEVYSKGKSKGVFAADIYLDKLGSILEYLDGGDRSFLLLLDKEDVFLLQSGKDATSWPLKELAEDDVALWAQKNIKGEEFDTKNLEKLESQVRQGIDEVYINSHYVGFDTIKIALHYIQLKEVNWILVHAIRGADFLRPIGIVVMVLLMLLIVFLVIIFRMINIKIEVKREKAIHQSKSRFLANVSHEIRTPMNAIIGMCDIVSREKLDDTMRENILTIKSAGVHLLAIINDILDFSKMDSGKMEIVEVDYDFFKFINTIKRIITPRAEEKGLKFIVQYDEEIPKCLLGDPVRIKQIIMNLLTNAVKFTKEGFVCLSVKAVRKGSVVDLDFKIEDTGIGIKPEDKKNLFNDFAQVDKKKNYELEGTGLGLSISRKLLELMNGTIEVESEYGVGAVFMFRIPQKISEGLPDCLMCTEDETKDMSFTLSGAKILIVDDNQTNLKVAEGLMKPYQADITTVTSGKAALELLEREQYDLIFMDHMMPDMDGIETLNAIREKEGDYFANIPVIVLTANAMTGMKEKFIKKGFQDFLSKPIELNKLEHKLKLWLPGKIVLIGDKEPIPADMEIQGISQIKVKGFDIFAGLNYTGNDPSVYYSVLESFYNEGKKKYKTIIQYSNEKKYKEYGIEVHALKSSSLSIGAADLSELCLKLEKAAKEEDVNYIEEHNENGTTDNIITVKGILPFTTLTKSFQNGSLLSKFLVLFFLIIIFNPQHYLLSQIHSKNYYLL